MPGTALSGQTRRKALRNYRSAIAGVDGEDWSGAGPGRLPWWRLGRPTEEDRLKRSESSYIDELGRSTGRWRPRYKAAEWLECARNHLGFDRDEIGGRGRDPDIVRSRELIGLVGIERFGVKVTELADALGKSRDGVSKWMRRGSLRRETDPDFAAAVEALDQAASEEP